MPDDDAPHPATDPGPDAQPAAPSLISATALETSGGEGGGATLAEEERRDGGEGACHESHLAQHQPALLRYANHLLRDAGRAQEVVQDTFARYYAHPPPPELGLPENAGRLKAWLFTVCRNRAFDVLKKERRMTPLTEPMTATQAHPAPPPEAVAEQRDTLAAVRVRLAELPGHQQEVVRLKFQAELSYKQIADVTGLTVSRVGNLLHHALKTLRTEMAAAD